jgi:hypothetical protein
VHIEQETGELLERIQDFRDRFGGLAHVIVVQDSDIRGQVTVHVLHIHGFDDALAVQDVNRQIS